MANKISLTSADDADYYYEPSDSDYEYTEREKALLKKVNGKKRTLEENNGVFAFDEDTEEDEQYNDDADEAEKDGSDSDFEHKGINIPNDRAWGKKRSAYFSTDFIDQDYSSYTAAEEKHAEEEESEAKKIQQRLSKQLNETDFTLDVFGNEARDKQKFTTDDDDKTHLPRDLTDLSQREKLRLFKKDSPEFFGLIKDFELRIAESINVLEPALKSLESKQLSTHPIAKFVKTTNHTILNYCTNIAFYVVLKAKRINVKNHPIVKRLFQMREILLQLDVPYDRFIKSQLLRLLQCTNNETLNFNKTNSDKSAENRRSAFGLNSANKFNENDIVEEVDLEFDKNDSLDVHNTVDNSNEDRRGITYQIAKNKGLTPHRKKELRNPRVKHRVKYRKALIRRKGAVRSVRNETKRYAGEISGIKASTKKSIKIK